MRNFSSEKHDSQLRAAEIYVGCYPMIKRGINAMNNLPSIKVFAMALLLPILQACSGGSGAPTALPISNSGGDSVDVLANVTYSGPDALNQDVRDYKLFFWDEVVEEVIGCASCHMEGGQGTVKFVRGDDINLAYNEALTVVNLADPGASAVVTRVANGHNCWSVDTNVCRDTLTNFITQWTAGAGATASTAVNLTAPADQMPTGAVVFPDASTLFGSTVYPLLTDNCVGCHSDTAPVQVRQTPLFAHSNVDSAYEAAKTKIDLSNVENSRLVVRLRDESHNCWSDCAANAAEMQAQIEALLPDTIEPVDPALVTSLALRLNADGIQASSGGRIETHVIAQYEFRLGSGNLVADRSNVNPLMPLTLIGDYDWLDNWGIQFRNGRAQASVNDSKKIFDELTATGEYSIEAWLFPGNVSQDDSARIISYSGSGSERNFTLGQSLYNYDFLNRSSTTDADGRPMFSTADADENAQAALQHVVLTYHPDIGRQIYVDGQLTRAVDPDPQGGGNLNSWDSDFAFILGNEVTGNSPWEGAIRFVAVHRRALSSSDIENNFDIGVGQKYFLLFRLATLFDNDGDPGTAPVVQELTDTPNSYLIFEVSQYDNYSYLFTNPTYRVLGADVMQQPLDIQGLRLGVNGKVTQVGQVFTQLDVQLQTANYDAEVGYPINSQGMLVPLENGPDIDQFFLSFEQLGIHSNVFLEATFDDPVFNGSGQENSAVAMRNYAEIRESFAQITGINSSTASVAATYNLVIQQLPSNEDILGFLSAHQMGVTQLAIAYCDAMVESKPARDAIGISLDEVDDPNIDDANAKSVAAWDADFIDPMITAALNTNLTVQPAASDVKDQLHHLLFTDADGIAEIDAVSNPDPDGLARCSGGCGDGITALAAKAGCAAVLASTAVTLQ